jgi:outer membrane protein assembly factor BamB
LAYREKVYVLYDFGFFGALNAKTGEEAFEQTRFPKRSGFTTSPWAYEGKIFCLNEDGVTYVMNAGAEFKVLHTNSLAEDDMGMATPAIAGDRLLIRTSARIYSIREGAGSSTD